MSPFVVWMISCAFVFVVLRALEYGR